MLMLFRDSGDNYQNVVHVTEYTNTGLIEGNFMHKEATSSLRMQTASPGFVSHPSPHPATGRPKLKRRSEPNTLRPVPHERVIKPHCAGACPSLRALFLTSHRHRSATTPTAKIV